MTVRPLERIRAMDRDLDRPLSKAALTNQAAPTGQHVLFESNDGIVHLYPHADQFPVAERFDKRLRAELEWVERFTSHAPSVGTHYERILSDLIAEMLPSNVKIGTGFVYDSLREIASPQIDILCYRDDVVAPLYRRSDFVILQPAAVLFACEVKKNLTATDLSKLIRKTIGCNMGTHRSCPGGVQRMAVFAYSCSVSTATLVRHVSQAIEQFLADFRVRTKGGETAFVGIEQLSVPEVFILGRDEHLSTQMRQEDTQTLRASTSIEVLNSGGVPGISPFLASLLEAINSQSRMMRRDHIASGLFEVISKAQLSISASLVRRISSDELLALFADAKALLKANRAYGAVYGSFNNPSDHSSLAAFSKTKGFRWLFHQAAARSGV